MYVPSFEKDHWHVIEGKTGDIVAKIEPKSGAHNTVCGLDGKHVYLAGLKSPLLTVADTASHTASRTVGPFSASVRPFTVNGRQTLCFVCVNELLGFEIGDIVTGQKLHRVEVAGFRTTMANRVLDASDRFIDLEHGADRFKKEGLGMEDGDEDDFRERL